MVTAQLPPSKQQELRTHALESMRNEVKSIAGCQRLGFLPGKLGEQYRTIARQRIERFLPKKDV